VTFYAAYAPDAPPAVTEAAAVRGEGRHVAWRPWRDGALAEAREAGRGVLLYFGADWCAECRVWKAKIFTHPDVVEASEDLDRIYVDVTENPTGEKAAFAERYRGRNPPAVIVLDAGGEVVKAWRDPPGVDPFVAALEQASGRP
jgi:protein disulfide-isomerase